MSHSRRELHVTIGSARCWVEKPGDRAILTFLECRNFNDDPVKVHVPDQQVAFELALRLLGYAGLSTSEAEILGG